jgi:hypothetical protein
MEYVALTAGLMLPWLLGLALLVALAGRGGRRLRRYGASRRIRLLHRRCC